MRDRGVIIQLFNCHFELPASGTWETGIPPRFIPPVCKGCFALVKSDCRYHFRSNVSDVVKYGECLLRIHEEIYHRNCLPWNASAILGCPNLEIPASDDQPWSGRNICVIAVTCQNIRNICKSKTLIFSCKLSTERDHRTRLMHMSLNKN